MEKKEIVDTIFKKFADYYNSCKDKDKEKFSGYEIVVGRCYDDLVENWSEEHADIFIKSLNSFFEKFNVK